MPSVAICPLFSVPGKESPKVEFHNCHRLRQEHLVSRSPQGEQVLWKDLLNKRQFRVPRQGEMNYNQSNSMGKQFQNGKIGKNTNSKTNYVPGNTWMIAQSNIHALSKREKRTQPQICKEIWPGSGETWESNHQRKEKNKKVHPQGEGEQTNWNLCIISAHLNLIHDRKNGIYCTWFNFTECKQASSSGC